MGSATLLSVNVGGAKDVPWHGSTVHTGIWKGPVAGRRLVRRLNIDGVEQGDRAAHGGANRAVLVYQIDAAPVSATPARHPCWTATWSTCRIRWSPRRPARR
jgi:MOSC domain-containing protein YiiM